MKKIIALCTVAGFLLAAGMPVYAAPSNGKSCRGNESFQTGNLESQQMLWQLLDRLLARAAQQRGGRGSQCRPSAVEPQKPCQSPELPKPPQNTEAPQEPSQPEEKPTETPAGTQTSATWQKYAAEVVKLVNAERKAAGLPELQSDEKVTAAAQKRAEEIVTKFSHTRPNGSSCFTALNEAGASYRGAGENIAMGQRTAAAVMQDWMNSSGHRQNIMNKDFAKIGVGCFQDANGRLYWTQFFTY